MGVTDDGTATECWELNLDPLQEQLVIPTTGPSLQPCFLLCLKNHLLIHLLEWNKLSQYDG